MKRTSSFRCASMLFTLGILGCDVFGGDSGKGSSPIGPAVGGTGATATGGSGATLGGAGGGPGGNGGTSAGSGGSAPAGCTALAGSAMVEVAAPNGIKYCVDRFEVTQGQYAEFLKKVTSKPGSEHAKCAGVNGSYEPKALPPDPYEPKNCEAPNWTPDATPNRPVVCIDWCDAQAYCAWAGKRLCGKVGGGGLALDLSLSAANHAIDASQSQWFNACSQGGKTAYPYGDSYDPLACDGADANKLPDGGFMPKRDVGTKSGCRGNGDPFSSIVDLSGSVDEFTDECALDTTGPGPVQVCGVRGGNSGSTFEQMLCSSIGSFSLGRQDNGVGFRCCKDL